MPERKITFGGVEIPAHVASTPHIIRGVRKMQVTPIAGTNREVVEMEDAWENYDQPYSFYLGDGSEDSIQESLCAVADVVAKKGYQILLDDYEPDIYRLAYYKEGLDTASKYTRLGTFKLVFRCRAERYLKEGNDPTAVLTGAVIKNPTAYTAAPLIHITGTGNGTITIGSKTMTITGMTDYLNIDSEKQDVYRLPAENKNNLASGEFPMLYSGNNTVTFTGGIATVTITPRFYVI